MLSALHFSVMNLISLDIDGVLTDYPRCWLLYLNQELGTAFTEREEARATIGEEAYRKIKDQYRVSDYKASLPLKDGAKQFYDTLVARGFAVWISTSRLPVSRALTETWLERNGIRYEAFIHKPKILDESFARSLTDVSLHVDDEMRNVEYLIAHGVPAILLSADAAGADGTIPVAGSYDAILDILV